MVALIAMRYTKPNTPRPYKVRFQSQIAKNHFSFELFRSVLDETNLKIDEFTLIFFYIYYLAQFIVSVNINSCYIDLTSNLALSINRNEKIQ